MADRGCPLKQCVAASELRNARLGGLMKLVPGTDGQHWRLSKVNNISRIGSTD
jgi:hypothetical protein